MNIKCTQYFLPERKRQWRKNCVGESRYNISRRWVGSYWLLWVMGTTVMTKLRELTLRRLSSRASCSRSPPNNFLKLLILTTIFFIKSWLKGGVLVHKKLSGFSLSLIVRGILEDWGLNWSCLCICTSVSSPYWPCFHQRCTHKKLGPASG